MRNIFFLLALSTLAACHRPVKSVVAEVPQKVDVVKPKPRQIQLQLASFTANDIQENLSLHDEIWVEYNLVAVQSGKIIRKETGSRFLGKIKQGAKLDLDSIPPLKITINPGEQLGVQVSLWELDDYSNDIKLLNQVNHWGGMLQVPLMILEWSALSNPVSWFMWGARIGGVGLNYWAKQNGRDLIGVSELQWDWLGLPKGNATRFKSGNWKGGSSRLNAFQYAYAYRVQVNE